MASLGELARGFPKSFVQNRFFEEASDIAAILMDGASLAVLVQDSEGERAFGVAAANSIKEWAGAHTKPGALVGDEDSLCYAMSGLMIRGQWDAWKEVTESAHSTWPSEADFDFHLRNNITVMNRRRENDKETEWASDTVVSGSRAVADGPVNRPAIQKLIADLKASHATGGLYNTTNVSLVRITGSNQHPERNGYGVMLANQGGGPSGTDALVYLPEKNLQWFANASSIRSAVYKSGGLIHEVHAIDQLPRLFAEEWDREIGTRDVVAGLPSAFQQALRAVDIKPEPDTKPSAADEAARKAQEAVRLANLKKEQEDRKAAEERAQLEDLRRQDAENARIRQEEQRRQEAERKRLEEEEERARLAAEAEKKERADIERHRVEQEEAVRRQAELDRQQQQQQQQAAAAAAAAAAQTQVGAGGDGVQDMVHIREDLLDRLAKVSTVATAQTWIKENLNTKLNLTGTNIDGLKAVGRAYINKATGTKDGEVLVNLRLSESTITGDDLVLLLSFFVPVGTVLNKKMKGGKTGLLGIYGDFIKSTPMGRQDVKFTSGPYKNGDAIENWFPVPEDDGSGASDNDEAPTDFF